MEDSLRPALRKMDHLQLQRLESGNDLDIIGHENLSKEEKHRAIDALKNFKYVATPLILEAEYLTIKNSILDKDITPYQAFCMGLKMYDRISEKLSEGL